MNDTAAPITFQINMLQTVIDTTWTLKSIHTGHEAFLSNPHGLAQLLTQHSH